jgi:Helicase conserved C-terminal domain
MKMSEIHKRVSNKIASTILNNLTGANHEVIYENPEDTIFLGAFSDEFAEQKRNIELPNSLGVSFSISKSKIKVQSKIQISFNCDYYYSLNPSYDEQIAYLINKYKEDSNIDRHQQLTFVEVLHRLYIEYLHHSNLFKGFDDQMQECYVEYLEQMNLKDLSMEDYLSGIRNGHRLALDSEQVIQSFLQMELHRFGFVDHKTVLAPKYKRVMIHDIKPLTLDLNQVNDFEKLITAYKDYYNGIIFDYAIHTKADILSISKMVRVQDLIDSRHFDSLRGEILTPNWSVDFAIDFSQYNQEYIFDIEISNKNKKQDNPFFEKYRYPYSVKMYNATILVRACSTDFNTVDGHVFSKIPINDLALSYRYNVDKYSSGYNCNTEYIRDGNDCLIRTINVSRYDEKRRVTRNHVDLTLKFIDYVENPIMHLENILVKMREEKESLMRYIDRFKSRDDYYQAAVQDVLEFEREIRRFEFGIECLKKWDYAKKSFKYLNETFHRNSDKFNSWRLFQLVFIVSNIPDLLVGEFGEDALHQVRKYSVTKLVDILYFSTGGGKTEAFLGCVIFSLFFDRLRGKDMGVTAIVKYPLRLLSIQQLDRFASKLATANQVKEDHKLAGKQFSLGYYVGSGNTLNEVKNYSKIKEEVIEDPEKYKYLQTCPNCGGAVSLEVDEVRGFIFHKCRSEDDCIYKIAIPFLFVDDEIYRNPPSVIISTLDKFAIMAYNSQFKNLFLKNMQVKDPAPTLVITDEIHLIKESLGTFSSHYESIFNFYCSELLSDLGKRNKPIKYMGATATISNYKHQSKELYMQDATLFPALSPNINKDFYSEVDENDITRVHIGILPFGTAPVTYILKMIQIYRETIATMIENIETVFIDELTCGYELEEILNVLYEYYIMIQYNNTKRDASRVRGGIDSLVNNNLKVDPKYDISTHTILTGDSAFSEVKDILSKIENANNPIEDDVTDYITATSMISHGVDNRKFNAIFFLGMPNLFAEYIQAYSRVGRHSTGFVFNVIRSRVREKSFLSNFNEYLEYKELLVSPIPISRYSIGALKKTFSGILLSLINIYYAPKFGYQDVKNYDKFKKILLEIGEKPLAKMMKRIYSHDENDGKHFNTLINELVHETFVYIRDSSNDSKRSISNVIYKVNSTESRPMRSLRDTDHPVLIELKGGN